MDEQVIDAPAEEVQEQPIEASPEAAQPEVQAEIAPTPSQPLFDLLAGLVADVAALKGMAHSGHNLDANAIEQIVALVLERINAGVQQRLG